MKKTLKVLAFAAVIALSLLASTSSAFANDGKHGRETAWRDLGPLPIPLGVTWEDVPLGVTWEDVPLGVTWEDVPLGVTWEDVPLGVTWEDVPGGVTWE